MAGFLNLEEAAAHLGLTDEEVRTLVDKRKIQALRDTSGQKFRREDLDRYLAELADDTAEATPGQTSPPAAPAAEQDSGLSLDGLELDLDESSPASVIFHGPASDAGPTENAPAASASSAAPEEAASLILDDDLELESGPALVVDVSEPVAAPAVEPEAEPSLVIGDDLDASLIDGPATLAGADDLLFADDDDPNQSADLANAQSVIVAGDDADALEISGLDMSLAGDLSGIELSAVNAAGDAPAADGPASLVIGDSFTGDLDMESLIAASGVEEAASIIAADLDSAAGSGLFGDGSGASDIGSGILVDSDPGSNSGPGSELSNVDMEGGLSLEGDEVKPWAVDLGEFLNDAEEDAHAQTMLGAAGEFDLDAEGAADDPSQSADLASASGTGDSMFDKSAGPGDSSFFGQDVLGDGATDLTQQSEMLSSSQHGFGIDTTNFDGWQVAGLVCCALLLLVGGLLTFDLVRTIGSPADTTLSNPLVGGLASMFGWR